jgi:hypothetical protein
VREPGGRSIGQSACRFVGIALPFTHTGTHADAHTRAGSPEGRNFAGALHNAGAYPDAAPTALAATVGIARTLAHAHGFRSTFLDKLTDRITVRRADTTTTHTCAEPDPALARKANKKSPAFSEALLLF